MRSQRGVTIVEIVVTLAVVAILVSLAVPSFQDNTQRRRLAGAGELVYEQFTKAKSESLKRFTPITVEFLAHGTTTWSFGLTTDDNCTPTITDPTADDACTVEHEFDANGDGDTDDAGEEISILMRWDSEGFPGVALAVPSFGGNPRAAFEPVRGTLINPNTGAATNGTVSFSAGDYSLNIVVSTLGRVRACSPGGSLSGYPDC